MQSPSVELYSEQEDMIKLTIVTFILFLAIVIQTSSGSKPTYDNPSVQHQDYQTRSSASLMKYPTVSLITIVYVVLLIFNLS